MSDYEKGVWIREGDLLFILEQCGLDRKGQPELRNRLMVKVEARREVSKEEVESLTAMLHEAVKRWQDDQQATATK